MAFLSEDGHARTHHSRPSTPLPEHNVISTQSLSSLSDVHRPPLEELDPDPGELKKNIDKIKVHFHPHSKRGAMSLEKDAYVDWRNCRQKQDSRAGENLNGMYAPLSPMGATLEADGFSVRST